MSALTKSNEFRVDVYSAYPLKILLSTPKVSYIKYFSIPNEVIASAAHW